MQMDAFCLHGEKAFYLVRIKGASKDDFFFLRKGRRFLFGYPWPGVLQQPLCPPLFHIVLCRFFPSSRPTLSSRVGPPVDFFSLFSAGFNQFFCKAVLNFSLDLK